MKIGKFKSESGIVNVKGDLRDGKLLVEIDERKIELPITAYGEGKASLTLGDRNVEAVVLRKKDKVWVAIDGRTWVFEEASEDELSGDTSSINSVSAPMPGKVIQILVSVGDEVDEGQPVIVVEAMKMEHTLRAPIPGKVRVIHCDAGQTVEGNVPLIEFEE